MRWRMAELAHVWWSMEPEKEAELTAAHQTYEMRRYSTLTQYE